MTEQSKLTKEQIAAIRSALVVAKRFANAADESAEISKAEAEEGAIASGEYERSARHKAKTASILEDNLNRKANRLLRADYAKQVFNYLVCYSLFVGAILILSGFKIKEFYLPDIVLGSLVGSTAAAAIGLVFSVTHGLFGKNGTD